MLFDFDIILHRLNGDIITRADAALPMLKGQTKEEYQDTPITLGAWAMHVLLDVVEIESRDGQGRAIPKTIPESEKLERYRAAQKIVKGGEQDITEDERQAIKYMTNVAANTELVGVVNDLLDAPIGPPPE